MEVSKKDVFKYAKLNTHYKSPIRPYVIEKGDLIEEKPCDMFNKEYSNFCIANLQIQILSQFLILTHVLTKILSSSTHSSAGIFSVMFVLNFTVLCL